MAGKKKVKAAKVRKKKWMPIMAPKIFNNAHIGDTHIGEDEEVLRKGMTLNLSTVLGDMRKQGYVARFDLTKVHEGKAYASLTGLIMTPSGTKRLLRRGRSKIEDSFLVRLKDDRIVRVKPLLVTINPCSKAAQTSIRLAVREKLKAVLAMSTLDSFVGEIIGVKIQRVLKDIGNKHHPIRSADIRAVVLLPKHKKGLAEEVVVEEAKSEEKPVGDKSEAPETPTPDDKPQKVAKKAVKKTAEPAPETAEKPKEEPAEKPKKEPKTADKPKEEPETAEKPKETPE